MKKTYEIIMTENKTVLVEAEDLCYENEMKNGIRLVYLTRTDDDGWNTIAMFNLDKIIGIREIKKEECEEQGDSVKLDNTTITCSECKYLMFSDCYGECSKGYKGIVRPNDTCENAERK